MVYLDVYAADELESIEAKVKAEIERQKQLDERSVDNIHAGEVQSGKDYNLQRERTTRGEARGGYWRHVDGWGCFFPR